ncbi:hypothetical protein DYH09_32895 [bacterium CPR1]|nr:hypothetical protein [bacterium CPR1]
MDATQLALGILPSVLEVAADEGDVAQPASDLLSRVDELAYVALGGFLDGIVELGITTLQLLGVRPSAHDR